MKTTVKFKDGFSIDVYPFENFYEIASALSIDISEVPQLRTVLTREDLIKEIVLSGLQDSVIDGMCSISGTSKELNCNWLISVGAVCDVKYEDVVNSGYNFKYFKIGSGTVYVLFSSVEDL